VQRDADPVVYHRQVGLTGDNQIHRLGRIRLNQVAYARARRLGRVREMLQVADRLAGLWPAGPWRAAIWEARGVLRQAEGDPARAAALFNQAADQ
jgi:hypothetical protein